MLIFVLISFLLFDFTKACANKLKDDLVTTKEKVSLLNQVVDAKQETIDKLEKQLKLNRDNLKTTTNDRNMLFVRWNTTNQYVIHLQQEFLRKQKLLIQDLKVEKSKVSATDVLLKALIDLQMNHRTFFNEIMDKISIMSERQSELLLASHTTHKNTLKILQRVVELNNKMQLSIDIYGQNQDLLVETIKQMTADEAKLYTTIHALRNAISTLEDEQREQVSEILDKHGEAQRLLITTTLNLVSDEDIWNKLNNNTLAENIEKLQMVRYAINESLKLIKNDNATLALNLQHNFEDKFEELRKEINWKSNQTMSQWVQEPIVKQKITRDLRNKALEKIKEIPLDGLNKQELNEITNKLQILEDEIKSQDIELEDLMKKRVVIDELKSKYEEMHSDHMAKIEELKKEEFNKTIDESKYLETDKFPIRSDKPTAQALMAPNDDPNARKRRENR